MCRCPWSEAYTGADREHYVQYHDEEWGVPVISDAGLFEHITLDGAQCGLSWSTILQRRDAYRRSFKGWDVAAVAEMVRSPICMPVFEAGHASMQIITDVGWLL